MSKPEKYVFIAYHFDTAGSERLEQLAAILNLLGISFMTGENVGPVKLSDGVQKRIESAYLVLALLTRDVKIGRREWHPAQWIIEEVTWAIAHGLPCLLVVEEGVTFDAALLGDLEQIRFPAGQFAKVVVRVGGQVQSLMLVGVDIPKSLPEGYLSAQVQQLILQAREHASENRWQDVHRCSDEALRLDPTAWRAALSKGFALARLGYLGHAERFFLSALRDFSEHDESVLSQINYNLAWIEEMRDGGSNNPESLQKQIGFLEQSFALDRNCIHTRAFLILCRVATEEMDAAISLLNDSRDRPNFLTVLSHIVETKGAVGHQLVSKLPEWLYPLLFPRGTPRITTLPPTIITMATMIERNTK